ncbi:UDP-N-acetylglucosamine--dolichyl-phosphate N-acetylglucosaminyltransferase [uncultured archaeon]|nr:UDP-N-acetylglucosamine--dolichyl-phosphate N-acetylglucosaminyltransferase [uncultured archaeon]
MSKTLVVVPACNEQSTIAHVVGQLLNLQHTGSIDGFVVVNDHSADLTVQRALEAGAPAVIDSPFPNNGKGEAVLTGLLWAKNAGADFVITLDADLIPGFTLAPRQISAMINPLEQNSALDMVVFPAMEATGKLSDGIETTYEKTPISISGQRALRLASLNFLFCPSCDGFMLSNSNPAKRFQSMASGYGLEFCLNTTLFSYLHLNGSETPILAQRAFRNCTGQASHDLREARASKKQRTRMFNNAMKQWGEWRKSENQPPPPKIAALFGPKR